MRTKALYIASCMPDVVKPYIEQTNDVTRGMSTSMDVSDRKAVTCLSDICHEPLEWLQLPLSKEAQREVTATAVNACIPSSASQPVSSSEWQQYSTQLCIVDDFRNRSRG